MSTKPPGAEVAPVIANQRLHPAQRSWCPLFLQSLLRKDLRREAASLSRCLVNLLPSLSNANPVSQHLKDWLIELNIQRGQSLALRGMTFDPRNSRRFDRIWMPGQLRSAKQRCHQGCPKTKACSDMPSQGRVLNRMRRYAQLEPMFTQSTQSVAPNFG